MNSSELRRAAVVGCVVFAILIMAGLLIVTTLKKSDSSLPTVVVNAYPDGVHLASSTLSVPESKPMLEALRSVGTRGRIVCLLAVEDQLIAVAESAKDIVLIRICDTNPFGGGPYKIEASPTNFVVCPMDDPRVKGIDVKGGKSK